MRFKSYKLFIDDERFPVVANNPLIIIARNYPAAKEAFEVFGCPSFISFDHDLGQYSQTGYDIAKLLIEMDMDRDGKWMPSDFHFYVHSQNPVGGRNIYNLLNSYRKQKRNEHV